jgi:hypothetical protein
MRFLVSCTYAEVTEESAEHGVFSDTGYVFEDQVMSLRELIEYIRDEYYVREGDTSWFTTMMERDLRTGVERHHNLHVRIVS